MSAAAMRAQTVPHPPVTPPTPPLPLPVSDPPTTVPGPPISDPPALPPQVHRATAEFHQPNTLK